MTHDEKKAALVAAGYRLEELRGTYTMTSVFISPDGTVIGHQLGLMDKYTPERALIATIDKAYAHLQREQELVVLRRLAIDVSRIGGSGYGFNYMDQVKQSALATILQFNITDDLTHEDVADLRHNRLDSLYDDDGESSETDE